MIIQYYGSFNTFILLLLLTRWSLWTLRNFFDFRLSIFDFRFFFSFFFLFDFFFSIFQCCMYGVANMAWPIWQEVATQHESSFSTHPFWAARTGLTAPSVICQWQKFSYFPSLDFFDFCIKLAYYKRKKWRSRIFEKNISWPKIGQNGPNRGFSAIFSSLNH